LLFIGTPARIAVPSVNARGMTPSARKYHDGGDAVAQQDEERIKCFRKIIDHDDFVFAEIYKIAYNIKGDHGARIRGLVEERREFRTAALKNEGERKKHAPLGAYDGMDSCGGPTE
jgi:hypothetical protein